jgi:prepilin-type N-terminal cleavage/methylation domain-containing protein
MTAIRSKRGFALVEMLVVIVIIAFLVALIIPAVNLAREAGRRALCLNRTVQFALAFQNYASTYNNRFPPSASLAKTPNGSALTVGGWSHLVQLLPFMEYDSLYKTLPANGDPEDTSNQAIVALTNTQLCEFICPSGPRRPANATVQLQSAAITNYKAIGATTRDSLAMVTNPQATPPYGTMSPSPGVAPLHPDGAIFPGAGVRLADIQDGLSHTILTMETIDETASRWAFGKEATLVGLPQKSSPTGTTPQPPLDYFAPPGYVEDKDKWGPDSAVSKAGLRTFLSYDFSPSGRDAGTYEDPGFSAIAPTFGPSSMHPEVVVCGMGDGSTQAISKQVDAANLFFLITKNGQDPFYIP